jgi:hypothetical protein
MLMLSLWTYSTNEVMLLSIAEEEEKSVKVSVAGVNFVSQLREVIVYRVTPC